MATGLVAVTSHTGQKGIDLRLHIHKPKLENTRYAKRAFFAVVKSV